MARLRQWIMITCLSALLTAGCNRLTPEERLEKMAEAVQQGDLLSAELEARKIIEKYPEDPAALSARMQLARIYSSDRRLDEAAAEYQTVLEQLPPDSKEAIQVLSMYNEILKRQQRFPEAMAAVEKFEQGLTTSTEALLNMKVARADIQIAAGETTQARAILTDLMDMTTNPLALQQFRQLYLQTFARDQNTTGAAEYLQDLLQQENLEPSTRRETIFQLASLYSAVGSYEQARHWTQQATEATELLLKDELDLNAQTRLLLELARLYHEVGNLEGGVRVLQRLYEANPDPALGQILVPTLWQLYLQLGRPAEAVDFIKKAAARYNVPELTQQVAGAEQALETGHLDQTDTTPIVLKFREDPPIVPTTWPESLSGEGTTSTLSATSATTGTITADEEVSTATAAPAPGVSADSASEAEQTTGVETTTAVSSPTLEAEASETSPVLESKTAETSPSL